MKAKLFTKLKPIFVFAVISLIITTGYCVKAEEPYTTYTYSNIGDTIFSPDLYNTEKVIYGSSLGIGELSAPEDITIGEDGTIYLADTKNNRIVMFKQDGSEAYLLENFSYKDGTATKLNEPQGVCVDNKGTIYICDSGNNRILCADKNGNISNEITKPDSPYFSNDIEFIPKKAAVDTAGNLYVTATGIYQGITMFSDAGKFIGFYGAEEVSSTGDVLKDYIWKQFMTAEQRSEMASYVPSEARNIFIDKNNFVLTISNSYYVPGTMEKNEMDHIRLLNPKGVNTIELNLTDYPGKAIAEDAKYLNFVAGCVDENGFITLLDSTKGRIFQFDSHMNLMAIFGGIGNSQGLSGKPTDICNYKDKLFVLDSKNGSLTVYNRTEYGSLIYNALQIFNTAEQTKAIKPWEKVLEQNANYDLAYLGIGRALLNSGKAKAAMKYFETGHDSNLYNEAFQIYRTEVIRKYGVAALLAIALSATAVMLLSRRKRTHALITGTAEVSKFTRFKNSVSHPFDGFERLKTTKTLSLPIAFLCMTGFALISLLEVQFTGKQFSMLNFNEVNIFWRVFSNIAIIGVWVLSNWCICVLIEGKANIKEIYCFTCYSLVPYTIASYIKILLSNILSRQEEMFIFCIMVIGVICSFLMIVAAFSYFHEFEGMQIIKALVLTVVGMVIIAILLFLVYMLMQKLISTLLVVINEIQFSFRMDR